MCWATVTCVVWEGIKCRKAASDFGEEAAPLTNCLASCCCTRMRPCVCTILAQGNTFGVRAGVLSSVTTCPLPLLAWTWAHPSSPSGVPLIQPIHSFAGPSLPNSQSPSPHPRHADAFHGEASQCLAPSPAVCWSSTTCN